MRGLFLPVIFIFLYFFSSCDENTCEEPTDVNLKIGFYTIKNNRETDSVVNNLTIYGIGREDSLIYNQAIAKKIILPLNQLSDTSIFSIRINDNEDICAFYYSRTVRLISHDCGFITEFDISEIMQF